MVMVAFQSSSDAKWNTLPLQESTMSVNEKVRFSLSPSSPYKRQRSDDADASTVATVSTHGTIYSSQLNEMPLMFDACSSNNDQAGKACTETRPLEVRFQLSCQVECPATNACTPPESMQQKIQKTARDELELLNKAREVKKKREQLTKIYKKITKGIPKEERQLPQDIEDKIELIKSKVRKAVRLENEYLKKSKKLRNQRYRWTKVIEHQAGEGVTPDLPPLPPSPQGLFKKGFFS